MEKKNHKWFRSLMILSITCTLLIGTELLGIFFRSHIAVPLLGFGISIFTFFVLFGGSFLANLIFIKWLKSKNANEIFDYVEFRIEHMKSNIRKEKLRLDLTYIGTVLYLVLFGCSILAICFFSGAADLGITTTPVILMFVLYGLIFRFFSREEKPDISYALKESDFDILYHIVREEADLSDRSPLYIFLGSPDTEQECNACVTENGNTVYLLLGPMLLCVAEENEFRQVVRHEFAHIQLKHTKETLKFSRLISYLTNKASDSIFDIWTSFAMAFPAAYLNFRIEQYFTFSSSRKESDADSYASNIDRDVHQASILAKLAAHTLFVYEEDPYLNQGFYGSETIPDHLVTDRIHLFREALVKRQQDWRSIIENQLPSKVASHPTFRQRWDALGNCAYSLEPASQTGKFAEQCWAAAAEADRRASQIDPERYEELRKCNYLDHLNIITEFEKNRILGTPEEMRPVIIGYYRIGMPEKAEALCDRLIAENDSVFATAFVRFWKGILLLHQYDKSGLDYIYQAMNTNRNYIEEGLSEIGNFCTMMGLEQELEHYRSISASYVQQEMDHCTNGIHSKAILSPEELPEGWQERIVSYILKHAGKKISQIYLVRETVNDGYAPSSFVLRYQTDTSDYDKERIYDIVFRLLDDWPIDWEFCLYDYEDSMEKILQRVPGSCIYSQQ